MVSSWMRSGGMTTIRLRLRMPLVQRRIRQEHAGGHFGSVPLLFYLFVSPAQPPPPPHITLSKTPTCVVTNAVW